jgi:glycosyltransferase involved in cell wall biosynthesis
MTVDFSVVIPTFRRPRELLEAVGSVLAQADAVVEVIVVDDSPEGAAREAIESVRDDRVSYLKNPSPTGGRPGAVRNLGWPRARGSFVHFLDDDDIVPRGHYAAVRAAFERHPDVGVVFGCVEPFGADETQLLHERAFFADAARRARASRRFGPRWGYAAQMFFCSTLLVCSAGVVRRECLAPIEGFDGQLRLMEDVDFYARAIRRFGAHFLDQVGLRYRIGPSLMHSPQVDGTAVNESYGRMYANYRDKWGVMEFLALKIFARTVLRIV